MQKRVIVSVINDLSTDQRVSRSCKTLHDLGLEVLLVGRKLPNSLPISPNLPYNTHRMTLLFKKGPLFYMEFSLRLLLFLLTKRATVLLSNDLDTLLPNYLISKIKKNILVYDSHEYFTEVPELQNNKWKKKIWKLIEKKIVPKLNYLITVNESIAQLYKKEYNVEFKVIRNMPQSIPSTLNTKTRLDLNLPENKKIIILQGAGINIDRGAEEAIEAMQWIEDSLLVIIGSGDVIHLLKKNVSQFNLTEKVLFLNKMPYAEMMQYTRLADLGLTLDKDTNVNYRYSLPNKLFDYIQAGIAVLASPLIEVKKIVDQYRVGIIIESYEPKHIADKINQLFANKEQLSLFKENSKLAAQELCWENEKNKLIEVVKPFV